MKYAYLSMPRDGFAPKELLKKRAFYARLIQNDYGYKVIDSLFLEVPESIASESMWLLGESLRLMSFADAYFMAPKWDTNTVCTVELEMMKSFGSDKPIYFLEDNDD